MSAPVTRDPAAVMTADGAVWTRRAVSPEGRGLYALTSAVAECPSTVMATLVELAEHGVLVVPGAVGVELERLRARLAELEAGPLFLVEYEGAEPHLFRDLTSAKALCDADIRREIAFTSGRSGFDWVEEDGVHQQIWVDPETDARRGDGPGRVTPLLVQPAAGSSVEVSADKLTSLLAPTQAYREEPHDGPLHHDYRVSRDLPETGGARDV